MGQAMQRAVKYLAMAAFAAAVPAAAEVTPKPGVADPRIRTVEYNPKQVFQLNIEYGNALLIQFSERESVEKGVVAMGDPGGWVVGPTGNSLLLKPTAPQADTNMTVITTKRTYLFDLNATKEEGTHMYAVRFIYPDIKARRQAIRRARLRERQKLQARLDQQYKAVNWNYWAKGSEKITPSRVWDNGLFTFFVFPASQPMPAVYVETQNGETLVNAHVNGNTLVVHDIARKFVLRLGDYVTVVRNRGFEESEVLYNHHHTSIPGVKRVVTEQGGEYE